MAVQFILGRSGTGKTTYCLEAIAAALREDSEQPLILLVPEQATYQAERALLVDERIGGYHRLQILSFNRLQFFLAGKNTAVPRLSNLGREMMVHKILRDCRDDLQVFRSSALLPGFAREIAGTITELHRYAKTPQDMAALEAQLQTGKDDRLAALKFADLTRIFTRYTEALAERFIDAEAQAHDACRSVANADFLRDARLWVDGFASFTGAETAILAELLKAVDQTYIALCLDPDLLAQGNRRRTPAGPTGLFEPTERTYRELSDVIRAANIELAPPVALQEVKRFSAGGPLAHLERNLFRLNSETARAGDIIRLASAANLRDEVRFVAAQVRRLVQDEGYRYRDVAVVASDLAHYEHYVRAYFDDYGIPFFIDRRRPLNRHPVVELLTAALQTVTGEFAHADVFAYLKTDLAPVEPTDVDVLENYCLAFGVDGRDWVRSDRWRFKHADDQSFDEVAINRIRECAVKLLLDLRQTLCPDGNADAQLTAPDFTRAVFAFLDAVGVREQMAAWVDEARQVGDAARADEHRQFYDKLIDIFDDLVTVFPRDTMTAPDYLAILNLAFSQMTLAFIPPRLDQVLVGSIERSRHPNLRAVFLLGATQRQFPVPIPSGGVLTDGDRDAAEAAGFHLAPTTTQSLAERQYLAYIAFTRPSDLLCISYPAVDEKGSPVVRSHFVDELVSLFEDVTVESIADSPSQIAAVHTQPELAELLCSRLGRDVFAPEADRKELRDVLNAIEADSDSGSTAGTVATALDYDNRATLERDTVNRLFGGQLKGSATRLATFAACPFKYFARYTLDLRTRREFKLEPLDLGNFYHAILDGLHKRLTDDGQNFATVEDDELTRLLNEQIETHTSQDAFVSKFVSRSDHNAFVITNAAEMLAECVGEIARMARAGAFRPVLSEVGFGNARDARETLGAFELPLPGGGVLTLSGKIDRLDVAEIDGRRIALVFDYKRTEAGSGFQWSQFYHGLNIQLPLYLLALSHAPKAPVDDVAGAFCLPIESAPAGATVEQIAQPSDSFRRKAKGLFNGEHYQDLDHDVQTGWSRLYNFSVTKGNGQYGRYATSGALNPADFERVLQFAQDKIVALAAEITAGRIDVHPYRLGTQTACAYCDFKAVCRFDWQVNDYNFLSPMNKLDVIASLKPS